MTSNTSHMLEQVLRGLAQDWSQFESMDQAFATLIRDARTVSEKSFAGRSIPAGWEEKWKELEETLGGIRAHAARTRALLKSREPAAAGEAPVEEWKEVARLDITLGRLLDTLQEAGMPPLDAPHRQEWEGRWDSLRAYYRAMQAHVTAVAVKLELHRRYGGEEAERIEAQIVSRLPDGSAQLVAPERFEKVAYELHKEHHQFKGLKDVARALLMYWETPDERLSRD